ncbi:MAG TPA: hypothetical protein VGD53_24095 [Actinoallomurus sp.]
MTHPFNRPSLLIAPHPGDRILGPDQSSTLKKTPCAPQHWGTPSHARTARCPY